MKKSPISRLRFVLFLVLFSSLAHAQTPPAAPASPGYWNLETNLTSRDHTIVRFYDAQHQLVYEERLPLCLDLSRRGRATRRATRQLNVALQQVLRDPQMAARSTALLAQQFDPGRRAPREYAKR